VVVTLAYLALQVRASTKESEANAYSVTGGDRSSIRSEFMEHADVWAKGNSGDELSPSERIVFDELVMSQADHHFFALARSMVRGSGRERLHVAAFAGFLHKHPVAYARWRSQGQLLVQEWARLEVVPKRFGRDWFGMVTEAVAVLERMEEPAEA